MRVVFLKEYFSNFRGLFRRFRNFCLIKNIDYERGMFYGLIYFYRFFLKLESLIYVVFMSGNI